MSTDAKPTISISFVSEIHGLAKSRGLTLTPDEVGAIDKNLNAITSVEGTTVSFKIGNEGRTVTLDEAVEIMSVGYGRPASIDAPEMKGLPATATTTQKAIAQNIANRDGRAAAMAIEARRVVDTYGNPWTTGNRTHQGFVTNKDPNLAAKLKMQAGTRK